MPPKSWIRSFRCIPPVRWSSASTCHCSPRGWRRRRWALSGLPAPILAGTGIYGVMAYAISRRTREIGIRMAIGASRSQVLAIVARRAVILIGSGTAAGLVLAMGAGRFLEQILYGVEPTDPVTLAIVLLLMLAIASLACWIPARRAIRINPVTELRQE